MDDGSPLALDAAAFAACALAAPPMARRVFDPRPPASTGLVSGRRMPGSQPAEATQGEAPKRRGRKPVTAADLGPAELEAMMARVAEARDRTAFAGLFDHFAPRLKAFLLQRGSDAATAEEVVQEAMLTVWRKAATFDRRQATVSTWIFTVARNKRIDRLRRERRPEAPLDDPMLLPEADDVEGNVGAREMSLLVKAAMSALPPEQAELVRMAYFEDKVHTVIAEETGLPLGTVKSRLRLALQRLRGRMEEEDF